MDALPFYRTRNSVQKPSWAKYPANPKLLGEHLRKVRMDKGLYQTQVARFIGVTEECIAFWENHRMMPQLKYYPKIIEFLGYYPFDHETETIGGKIRQIRYWYGLTYKRCGKQLGVSYDALARWEAGKTIAHAQNRRLIEKVWSELPCNQQHEFA